MGIIMKTIKRSLGNGVRKEDDIKYLVNEFMERHTNKNDKRYSEDNIYSWKILPDNSVWVVGDVNINEEDLVDGKLPFKFSSCDGDFRYKFNNKLTSLEGCPKLVKGDFWIYECFHVQTLEFAPEHICGDILISRTCINSLEGCPSIVDGDFIINRNIIEFSRQSIGRLCRVGGNIYTKLVCQ